MEARSISHNTTNHDQYLKHSVKPLNTLPRTLSIEIHYTVSIRALKIFFQHQATLCKTSSLTCKIQPHSSFSTRPCCAGEIHLDVFHIRTGSKKQTIIMSFWRTIAPMHTGWSTLEIYLQFLSTVFYRWQFHNIVCIPWPEGFTTHSAYLNGYHSMMTSSNGNIFRVTGPLCGEFAGLRWIPRTKASEAEL